MIEQRLAVGLGLGHPVEHSQKELQVVFNLAVSNRPEAVTVWPYLSRSPGDDEVIPVANVERSRLLSSPKELGEDASGPLVVCDLGLALGPSRYLSHIVVKELFQRAANFACRMAWPLSLCSRDWRTGRAWPLPRS